MLIVPSLAQLFPMFCGAMITEDFETWEKLLELHLPIQQHASRNNLQKDLAYHGRNTNDYTHDKMRAPDASITCHVCQ